MGDLLVVLDITVNDFIFSTRAASYKVIINTLKNLPNTKLDAAFGITGLVSLYLIRFTFDKLSRIYPRRGKDSEFCAILQIPYLRIISPTFLLHEHNA